MRAPRLSRYCPDQTGCRSTTSAPSPDDVACSVLFKCAAPLVAYGDFAEDYHYDGASPPITRNTSTRWRKYHTAITSVATGIVLGLMGCGASPTVGGGYNATTPTNVFEQVLFEQLEGESVVIASVNLGAPRNYLKNVRPLLTGAFRSIWKVPDTMSGPSGNFRALNNAVLIYGDPIDPTTGRVNQKILYPDCPGGERSARRAN